MSALDLPSPNYMLPPSNPVQANMAEQLRRQQAANAEAAAQQQKQQLYPLELQQHQQAVTAGQQREALFPSELQTHEQAARVARQQGLQQGLQQTMGADLAQWADAPAYRGQDYQHAPPEAKQHFLDAYGEVANTIPGAWNSAQQNATGNPQLGLEQLPPNASASTKMGDSEIHISAQPKVPAEVLGEASRLHVPTQNRPLDDISRDIESAQMKSGVLPEKYMPQANRLIGEIQHNPVLAPYAKQKAAYDTMKTGFEHPEAGGFSDMALIEGFQRIVNPGAVVRQGTMNNMQGAVGWLSKLDPSFLWNHAVQGDKLTPEARQRLMGLAESEYSKSSRMAARELAGKRQLARMLGIQDADAFVGNVLNFVGNSEPEQGQQPAAQTQPTTPQDRVQMTSPDGQQYFIPKANVEAAKARGFK